MNLKLAILKYKFNYHERDNQYLIIFPEIPYWLFTNRDGLNHIQYLSSLECNKEDGKSKKLIQILDDKFIQIHESFSNNNEIKNIEFEIKLDDVNKDNHIERFLLEYKNLYNLNIKNCSCGIIFLGKGTLNYNSKVVMEKVLKSGFEKKYIECDSSNIDVLESVDNSTKLESIMIEVKDLNDLKSLNKRLKNILIKLTNSNVIIKVYFYSDNIQKIDYFLEYCKYNNYYPEVSFNIDKINSLSLTYVLDLLNKISKKKGYSKEFFKYTPLYKFNDINMLNNCKKSCGIGCNSLYIRNDLKIFTCMDCSLFNELSIGSLYEKNINFKMINAFRKLNVNVYNKCKDCDVKFFCGGGCRAMAYMKNKSLIEINPWCRDYYKLLINLIWQTKEALI